jgi:hypothetical protein
MLMPVISPFFSTRNRPHVLAVSLTTILLCVALILLTRPYTGIRHDSILYFGQALAELYPEVFRHDLFFEFGSQAQFTLAHRLIALLLQHGTPAQVSIGMVLMGLMAFFLASWVLARALLRQTLLAALAVLALIVMPSGYGAFSVFSYAESFLTGRTLAEPLALLSLALLLQQRWWGAAVLLLVASLMHPLIALPVYWVGWVWLVLGNRRWLHLAWGLLLVPVLVWVAPDVAAYLLRRYDAEWWEWIQEPNRHVFLLRWPLVAWAQLATDAFLVGAAARLMGGRVARFGWALLIAAALSFLASLLLGDMLRMVLPAGLQMWRTQWLLHWGAMALTPAAVLSLWVTSAGTERRGRALLLVAVALFGAPAGAYSAALAAPLTMGLYVAWPALHQRVSRRYQLFMIYGVAAAVVGMYVKFVVLLWPRRAQAELPLSEGVFALLLHPVPLIALLGVLAIVLSRHLVRGRVGWVLCSLGVVGLVAAANQWDKRSNWNRYLENSRHLTSPFGYELPRPGQVYWQNELLAPWLVLKRPSYWNDLQRAGLLFNRGTAEEAYRRSKEIALIEFQSELCGFMKALSSEHQSCAPEISVLRDMCQNEANKLEYIVVDGVLPIQELGVWNIPNQTEKNKSTIFRLYDCMSIMKDGKN